MKNNHNPIDISVQCRCKLLDVENKVDLMLAEVHHTNKMINEVIQESMEKRS